MEFSIPASNSSWTAGTKILISTPLACWLEPPPDFAELRCDLMLPRGPVRIATIDYLVISHLPKHSCSPEYVQPLCESHSVPGWKISTLTNEGYPGLCYNQSWLPKQPLRYRTGTQLQNSSTLAPTQPQLSLLEVTLVVWYCPGQGDFS